MHIIFFMDGQKGNICDHCFHFTLASHWSKGKVHQVNLNIYNSVIINVDNIYQTMAFFAIFH